jgi:rSAM/selenodomain-associated transferase 1
LIARAFHLQRADSAAPWERNRIQTDLPKRSIHSQSKKPPSKGKNKPVRRGAARNSPAVAVFARAIVPGKTKTRLIPALGAGGAADFHRALVSDALHKTAKLKGVAAHYLFTSGGSLPKEMVPEVFECRRQQGRDLAQRLQRAFTQLLRWHSHAVIIGTDSPLLSPAILRLALEELRTTDAVLGPCPDGGYYLIGLRRTCRGIFNGLRLGTEFAFGDTLASLIDHGLSCSVLEPCPDVDLPEDLTALKKSLAKNPAARSLAPHTWQFLSKAG